jgi:NAD(P)-dependent dehydrogenase (short-subunit alcohol dehydrogenase family)
MFKEKALLTDRVAIVTGAAGGIGRAIAECYAEYGAHLVLVDLKEQELQEAARSVRALGRKALAFPGDCRQQALVDQVMRATLREFGRINIMVNNAGGTMRKLFMEMTESEWMESVDRNLLQTFRWTHGAAQAMIEKGIRGSIINVTTIEGYRAAPGYAPYAAAKAGLANFTKTMALELSPWGIRVNSLAPDVTVTPGILKLRPDWEKEGRPSHVPMGRRGRPEDHAGAALYLASDLSEWVTGEAIHVGGGTFAASGWKLTPSGHWSTDGVVPQVYSGKPLQ